MYDIGNGKKSKPTGLVLLIDKKGGIIYFCFLKISNLHKYNMYTNEQKENSEFYVFFFLIWI